MEVIKRGVTFSKTETALLVELVSEYKDLLESRSTDGTTNKMKVEAWNKIEDAFNAKELGMVRSSHHLKLKYVDMKRQLRKKVADYRRQISKGKGTPTLLLSSDESMIYTWLHPSSMGLNDSSHMDSVTLETTILDDFSSNHSMLSDSGGDCEIIENDIVIEEPKMEPVDYEESITKTYHEDEHPSRKRKANDEEISDEFVNEKEAKEDNEHKLKIQRYEMEISILKMKLKETETDNKISRYEKEMLAYYKRREAKEDKEHNLLVQKYELEIALLRKNFE
ncbi:hypothetical protein ACFFRR_007202 [Megaselia abdita]